MKKFLIIKDGATENSRIDLIERRLIELGYEVTVQEIEETSKINGLEFDMVLIDEQLEK